MRFGGTYIDFVCGGGRVGDCGGHGTGAVQGQEENRQVDLHLDEVCLDFGGWHLWDAVCCERVCVENECCCADDQTRLDRVSVYMFVRTPFRHLHPAER